ncbi:hypothetical protein Tco_0237094, partial [Tanacetum coccineum]
MNTTESLTLGEEKRFRGLHRYPSTFGPLSIKGEKYPLTPRHCLPLLLLAMMLLMRTMLLLMKLLMQLSYPVPHSPPVSPVREPSPERQSASERPPSLSPTPPAQTFGPEPRPAGYVDPDVLEPIIFGPQPRPSDFVDPDLEEPVIFGPPPRPDNYIEPADIDNLVSMEDDTIHGGFHEESPLDMYYGAYRLIWKQSWKLSKKIMGGAIFDTSLVTITAALGHDQPAVPSADVEEREEEEANLSADGLPHTAVSESAGPSVAADKGKAPMPELDIPAEFVAEDAQARKRFEEEQASERLVQRLRAEDLAQADLPNVSAERAKELDDLMMRMTETDWLTLMMQVGTNPALARELLGADVNEDNFIERMTAIKERKKRALADLRYRALKGKPLKQSEVTEMMRNLVKNQWCAAHHGTITMKAVKAMSKQQLIDEYEYICRRLEKDRLLSAQYNLFRPKPVISEPPSKRQRVDRDTSQPSGVPAASTQHADDPDSAGGGSFQPAGSATPMAGFAVPDTAGGTLGTNVTASTVPTSAAMDSAGSH